jgi:motility quorum-sensing regulator/GCU-specific mRNA interferase toxin
VPYYDLARIKTLIREGQYRITTSAIQSAHSLGFGEDDICSCILDFLDESNFYKAMPSERFPGLWQDVYKVNYRQIRVYLKVQIAFNELSVVISFKEDES